MERQTQNAWSQHSNSKRENGKHRQSDCEVQPWRSSVSCAHLGRPRPSHFGHMKAKNWLIRKDPDSGKDWRQEERGMTEDEMVGRHHRLNGHEFEQALGDDEGQGRLACCSPWGRKESDTTEWLNNSKDLLKGRRTGQHVASLFGPWAYSPDSSLFCYKKWTMFMTH